MISVLCVDDDSAFLEITKIYLEEPGELTVTTALSVPEALKEMGTNRFDAVVADYQMPIMNGIEFLKAVRAENPFLPFILFTGKGREEVVIEAFNSGTDFYLQKGGEPRIRFAELKDTIKKAVRTGVGRKEFHDSETRYRRLFETAKDGILILDADSGKITDANPLLLTLLGYTRDEILGKKLWEIGVIRDKALAEQAAAEIRRTGYLRYDDLSLKTKNGRDIAVEFVSNVYDAQTQNLIQCNIREITERKRAEEMARVNMAKYKVLFESIPLGITISDKAGNIVESNRMAEHLLGLPKKDQLGRRIDGREWQIIRPDGSPMPADEYASVRALKENCLVANVEMGLVKEKGDITWIVVTAAPIPLEGYGVAIAYSDITGHKQGEDALRESELRYRTLFDNMLEGLAYCRMLYDKENRPIDFIFLNVNPAFYRIIGASVVEGRSINEVFPGIREAFPGSFEIFVRVALTGEPESFDLNFKPSKKWLHISVHSPEKEYFVASFEDITERKAAEEAMRVFSENLERTVIERTSDLSDVNLKLMTEIEIRLEAEKQLTKTVGEKEVLLREVHHRVKNNLQIIISLLNLQSRHITDATTLSAFRESQNRVRAMALVHEKLYQSTDLAKIDFDNYIGFLANNLLQFFGMKGKGILLTMDIKDIFLATDTAIPLGLIINELISNSLKYAFPGGRTGEITLVIHKLDHTLTILFKDNGVGIPDDFDWRNAMSMGLRLVIILVEQLEGTIELDRTAGTIFRINVREKL